MNSRFSFVWCSVLLFCLSVSATEVNGTEAENNKALHECLGQYFKSKGKLDYDVSASKESSLCLSTISRLSQSYRDEFGVKVRAQNPGEADCVMREFDETELADLILTVGFYQTGDSLTESEKKSQLRDLKKLGDDKMATMTSKCGVNGVIFDKFMFAVFSTSTGEPFV